VDGRLVILVGLVKKVMLEVPNAPVATLVNRVRVIMVCAKHVRGVNLVNPMTILLILARHATLGFIKKIRAKRLVYPAYLERMQMVQVSNLAKDVAKDNIKIWPAMNPVWIVKLVNT